MLPINTSNQEIVISRVHVELTDLLTLIVRDKVHRLFNHDDKIIRIPVIFEMSRNKAHQNEFIARGPMEVDGPDLEARAATGMSYKSIDAMVSKLDRQ
jgi:putative sigma-54 modulation protein